MKRFWKRSQGGFYRSRNGMILGVCKGIAEYFDFSIFWARILAVFLFLISGFWPAGALYFIGALLMKPEPVMPFHHDGEEEFYDSYIHSKRAAADRLKRRYSILERRLQRLEHTVTSKEYDWDSRLNA